MAIGNPRKCSEKRRILPLDYYAENRRNNYQDTRERLNPALRRALGFTQGFLSFLASFWSAKAGGFRDLRPTLA
jgi:hypothetical protein